MLKDEIESLIRRGKLTKYRHYGNWQMKGEQQREHEHSFLARQREMNGGIEHGEQQILGTIETIFGGFIGKGTSNNVKKRHLRAVMTAKHKKMERAL